MHTLKIKYKCFPSQAELDEYIVAIEEAKKRDHRKIRKEINLFALYDEGPGFPFFLPKGMILRNELENFWREEHRKCGYEEIKTPLILNEALWYFNSFEKRIMALKREYSPS